MLQVGTDSSTSTTHCSSQLEEPANLHNDDEDLLFDQLPQKERAEVSDRADRFVSGGQWQVWDHERDLTESGVITSARTTFYPKELSTNNPQREKRFDRMWKLQMGRGHTWENDSAQKTLVRTEAMLMRCDAILQQCYVPKWARTRALSRVRQTNLNGFSRYYEGADGACIGFALLGMYTGPEEAKTTEIANRAPSVIPDPDFDEETVEGLIDYVFRKYGEEC